MNVEEPLYSDIPPTKLRNKEEQFKPAKTSKFWLMVASLCFFNMLQNRFYALRYSGMEQFSEEDSDIPTIIYAPHCNWWDGIVMYNIVHRIFHKEIRLMVEELNRFPLLRRGGAYSVNKKSPQSAMRALKYSIEVLSNSKNILAIFPQGIIRPPHYRPMEFQKGLAYIAQNAAQKFGKINLVPVGLDYVFLRDNRPEVIIKFGEKTTIDDPPIDRTEFSHFLEQSLAKACDDVMADVASGDLSEYRILFKQHLKWYRRIEQRLKSIDLPPVSGV